MSTIRDEATVRVTEPVDGSVRRRGSKHSHRNGPVEVTNVDPEAMAHAEAIRRPGEHIVVVSATEVWLWPDGKPRPAGPKQASQSR